MVAQGARGGAQKLDRRSSRITLRRTDLVSQRWEPIGRQFAATKDDQPTGWPEYPLVVSGYQIEVRGRYFEQNRLCGPDCDLEWRRTRGSTEKSGRYRQSELSGDLPFFAKAIAESDLLFWVRYLNYTLIRSIWAPSAPSFSSIISYPRSMW
jgi:hypothetical protein